jgi:uncharacterized protein (TIGR03083 family)
MADIWPCVHAERRALAEDLADLDAVQWATPSLDAGWSVQDVLAHMTATAVMTPPKFFGKMLASGFSFTRFSQKEIDRRTAGGPAQTLAAFRAVETSTKAPPGPKDSWLGETIIHAEDIRRPLGIRHAYPTDKVVQTLDFYKASNLIVGTKSRIAGLTLKATDTDWTHGSGPLVEGPALSLLLAATGRKVALDDLSGDGVPTLRSR